MDEEFLRKVTVSALIDTEAYYLCINQDIASQLGLPLIEKKLAEMADGTIKESDAVGPIEVRFKNRKTTVDAMVMSGNVVFVEMKQISCYLFDNQLFINNRQLITNHGLLHIPVFFVFLYNQKP